MLFSGLGAYHPISRQKSADLAAVKVKNYNMQGNKRWWYAAIANHECLLSEHMH